MDDLSTKELCNVCRRTTSKTAKNINWWATCQENQRVGVWKSSIDIQRPCWYCKHFIWTSKVHFKGYFVVEESLIPIDSKSTDIFEKGLRVSTGWNFRNCSLSDSLILPKSHACVSVVFWIFESLFNLAKFPDSFLNRSVKSMFVHFFADLFESFWKELLEQTCMNSAVLLLNSDPQRNESVWMKKKKMDYNCVILDTYNFVLLLLKLYRVSIYARKLPISIFPTFNN